MHSDFSLNTHTHIFTHIHIFVLMFFFGHSVVLALLVDIEGVGFRPSAVVVGKEVVSGCTRISSQEYVHEK